MSARAASLSWFAWVAILGIATARIWQWHLDYFKSPGPQFYRIALVLIPAVALTAWIYSALRGRSLLRGKPLRRYEPSALLILVATACAVYEPRAAAVSCLLFLSCCAAGKFALRKFGLPLAGPLERFGVGFGGGAGIMISLLVLAGLSGLLFPAVFLTVLLLPILGLPKDVKEIFTDFRDLQGRWGQSASAAHPLTGVALVFGAAAAVCALLVMLAPSVAYDPIAFHLPSVEYYATTHSLRSVPNIEYSYYPQGFEMLWTLGYALAGQAGAQMISAMFFLVFSMMLIRVARECGLDAGTAVLAAIFGVTMPFVHWSGSVMKNDLALAFFEALAVYGFLRWLDCRNFRWIVAGTFFLAQALGIKYVAVFGVVPLALFFGYATWSEHRRWAKAALLTGIFVVFGASWMARAYWLTGNPVAPEKLGMAVGENVGTRRPLLARVERYAEMPWIVLFHGEDAFESPLLNPMGILLFALAPLALLGGKVLPRSKAQLACAIFAGMYLLYWMAILNKVRYAILPFALMAIWLAARSRRFYDAQARTVRISVLAVVTYCLLIALMGLMIIGVNGPQLAYFAGRLDRPGYLRAAMRAYGAVDFLRGAGVNHARVFGVENLARFYSADPFAYSGMWCPETRGCDPTALVAETRRSGAEYLILPKGGIVPPSVLEDLGQPGRVYEDAYFSVYRLTKASQ